jgi:hypothetical protein
VHFKRSQCIRILDYIGDFLLEHSNGGPTLRNYPDWRLFNYLPFFDRKGYIKSLTVYCEKHSLAGIVAHGESSTLVGSRKGLPIHLTLHQNERIISVWIRVPHEPDFGRMEADPTFLVGPIMCG